MNVITHAYAHLFTQLQIKEFSRKLAKACETELKIGPADGSTTENPFWVDVSSYSIKNLVHDPVAMILCDIQFVEYDYGLENINPFECKMFYTRDNPDEAISIPRDQVSIN